MDNEQAEKIECRIRLKDGDRVFACDVVIDRPLAMTSWSPQGFVAGEILGAVRDVTEAWIQGTTNG